MTHHLTEKEYKITGSGFTFPVPFANVQDEESRDEYIASKKYFDNKTLNLFNTSLNAEILNKLSLLAGNLSLVEPKFKTANDNFASATQIRCFKENMGGLTTHTGNYFQDMFQFFYQSLNENIGKHEQISYFFSIQKPAIGGELFVYNLTWKEAQNKKEFQDNEVILLVDGTELKTDEIEKTIISPEPGDLFIFHGGNIWHRVNEVSKTHRITMGGFMAKSLISNQIYLWS